MCTGERRHTFEFVNGLRGLAALQVVALHYCASFLPFFARVAGPAHYSIETKLAYSPVFFLIDGYSAVYLFFLMSGFVLTPSFIGSSAGVPQQIAKRFTRLYIPVIGAVALSLALTFLLPSAKDFAAQQSHSGWVLALFENPLTVPSVFREFVLNSMLVSYQGTSIFERLFSLTSITESLDAPLWTIHIEFWGSALTIFVCAAYQKLPRSVFWLLFLLLLVCTGTSQFSLFLVGFAIFAARDWLLKRDGGIYLAAGVTLIAIAIVASSSMHEATQKPLLRELSVTAIFIGVIFLGARRRLLESGLLLWLGRISFSLYLVHFPILFTATLLVFKVLAIHLSYGASVLSAGAIMLPITPAVAHYFERKRSILHTRGQYGRVVTVASIRWLDQALLSGQAVGFEMLNGSRSVTSASNARCGNSLSTRTRYA
jgi:peptidoglycan/LPS O-acetylase OafA/YrhL